MARDMENIGKAGLSYYAEMTASIIHEIKNVLAVINESAGLIGDYAEMAEKGIPMSPERLLSISGKMKEQVGRGDTLARKMNRFAHCHGDAELPVDLFEIIEQVVDLASRIIENRRNSFDIDPPQDPVMIHMNRFLLMNLIWCCLKSTMDSKNTAGHIRISHRSCETFEKICFHDLNIDNGIDKSVFSPDADSTIFQAAGARFEIDSAGGFFALLLPRGV